MRLVDECHFELRISSYLIRALTFPIDNNEEETAMNAVSTRLEAFLGTLSTKAVSLMTNYGFHVIAPHRLDYDYIPSWSSFAGDYPWGKPRYIYSQRVPNTIYTSANYFTGLALVYLLLSSRGPNPHCILPSVIQEISRDRLLRSTSCVRGYSNVFDWG